MGYLECNDIEDLIFNRSFQTWVLSGDPKESVFWDNWIAQHPEKLKLLNDAKAILYALQINFKALSSEDIDGEIKKILVRLRKTSDEAEFSRDKKRARRLFSLRSPLMAVAACLLLLLFSFLYYSSLRPHIPVNHQPAFLAAEKSSHVLETTNGSDTAQRIILPDGSLVWLEQKARLQYGRDFSDSDRKVYLVGEAFFDIKKDPSRPFFVFTNSITTKVLGTSFRVRAYASDKKAVVTVNTGKVSVYKPDAFTNENARDAERNGIIVTPNQTIVYNPENNDFNKSLADKPALTRERPVANFVFDGTPVSKVFKTIQDAYSIPIIYDEEIISTCSLSARLGNESFYEKLDIICKAINASYETMDGTVIITAHGCK